MRNFWQLEEHSLGQTTFPHSPAMTDKCQIPNPCTSCHTDKPTAWALEAMRKWPERSPWLA